MPRYEKYSLENGYGAEIDRVDETAWCRLLSRFDDGNLNQTWAYGAAMAGRGETSHMVLRCGEEVVALAQARVVWLPLFRFGLAYVSWGPIWQRRDQKRNVEHFRQAIRALRNEYVCRRGLVLRLFPLAFDDDPYSLRSILQEEGFCPSEKEQGDRTLLLDLTLPLDELRKGLDANWRRWLRISEASGLEVVEGTGDECVEEFIGLYNEMSARKMFPASNYFRHMKQIQSRLPEGLKMRLLFCREEGTVCAGLAVSVSGGMALEIAAATNDRARQNHAAYLLRWKLLETLKQDGIAIYNLHGINPEGNPGTYHFKRGLAGKKGRDLCYLGKFDASPGHLDSLLVSLLNHLRKGGEALRSRLSLWCTAKHGSGG
ncbi:MAG: peptidoglycan bridge formation glycyltransferase FemA/FemB family protein [Terracidiphilus sp.]|nr:peptidoglycan bridge formation glycyltransferase FemA/FemB family protein [Terracidiphilus sp.]